MNEIELPIKMTSFACSRADDSDAARIEAEKTLRTAAARHYDEDWVVVESSYQIEHFTRVFPALPDDPEHRPVLRHQSILRAPFEYMVVHR